MFLPLDCDWGIQEYSICRTIFSAEIILFIKVSEVIMYSWNKSTGSLTWNKLTIVFLFQVKAIIVSVALLRTIIHSRWYLCSFLLIIPLTVLHSWLLLWCPQYSEVSTHDSLVLKLEDKNRLMKPYWFAHCRDPFTESVEGEMNWYKANKTRSPVFRGN